MLLEELKSKIPKRKRSIENFFNSCMERKSFVKTDSQEYVLHLEKSKHDLNRALKEFEDKCFDWTIIKAINNPTTPHPEFLPQTYYAVHHAANALLIKKQGMFSKNHICLLVALKYLNLIPEEFYQKLREIHSKFSDFSAFEITYSLRKISQYSVAKWKELTENDTKAILLFAKQFVAFVEGEVT